MHVTKRSLGEGYIVATGVVLASVLFGSALQRNPDAVLWSIAWSGPVLFLAGAAVWLNRLDLTSDQVWLIAQFSALGLGVGTLILVSIEVVSPTPVMTTVDSILLIATLSTMAVAGTMTGLALTFYRAEQETRRRNAVLNRVLRHNLRNDMTVVLCALDAIEAKSNGECTESIQQAREKITSLVSLTDKLRQSGGGRLEQGSSQQVRDVSSLVTERVEHLRETYPDLTIETSLVENALAPVDESFGLVIDNIVECAISRVGRDPQLGVSVQQRNGEISVSIDDRQGTIPPADLGAISSGAETALEHGQGVELWLADWLVDENGGDMKVVADDECQQITITVDAASQSLLSR